MFEAKIIKDSITNHGSRLTTMEWTYPRFIHAEIMTHRDRARNAASSRAIPWPKMMERIVDHPVVPLKFLMEQRGMQGGEELSDFLQDFAEELWLSARDKAVEHANELHNIGKTFVEQVYNLHPKHATNEYFGGKKPTDDELEALSKIKIHKSLPNRITEPWMWITVCNDCNRLA